METTFDIIKTADGVWLRCRAYPKSGPRWVMTFYSYIPWRPGDKWRATAAGTINKEATE